MRTIHVLFLVLAALVCLTAAAFADEGLVMAGTCDDAGVWSTKVLTGLPAKATTGPVDAAAKVPNGLKLREVTTGRPLDAKVLGNVKAGSEVKIVALRVLGAAPGILHVVWAQVTVAPERIVK